jgi:hypothetical protein
MEIKDRNAAFYEALRGEDELGLVIRAHIHIEHELVLFIRTALPWPDEWKVDQTDYDSKVRLALALDLNRGLKSPLNRLGSLRNDFAHKLTSSLTKQVAKSLYAAFDGRGKQAIQQAYLNTRTRLPESGHPTAISSLSPKDQIVLYLVTLRAAVLAERMALEASVNRQSPR